MNEREAIEFFNRLQITLARRNGKYLLSEALDLSISALEKQIAIRPLAYDNEYEEWLECPKCSESIPEYTEENETQCYCLKCGQKLELE